MRKIIILCLIFISASVFSQEETAVWTRLYDRAQSLDQQYAIMSAIIERNDPILETVILDATRKLQESRQTISGFTETYKYERLLKMMINELGDLKFKDAASELIMAYRTSDNIYLKSDAVIALGKVGAVQYAEELSDDLKNINIGATKIADKPKLDTIVLSLIISLERLGAEVGFEPIFFASIGYYSRELRAQAAKSLKTMIDDPSDLILSIISNDDSQEIIYSALTVERDSNASPKGKEDVSVEVLRRLISSSPINAREKNYYSQNLVLVCNMLEDLKFTREEAGKYLAAMIDEYINYRKYNIDEMIAILGAMGTNSSDTNVTALSTFLEYLTDQKEAGRVFDDLRVVKAVIQSLGATGSQKALEELTRVSISIDWGSSVIREAKAALEILK